MKITKVIMKFFFDLNEKGIWVPLFRNPKNNEPDPIFTMMLISFAIAALGLIGKFTNFLGEVDTSGANYLFLSTAGLFLGHKMVTDAKNNTVNLDPQDKEKSNESQ